MKLHLLYISLLTFAFSCSSNDEEFEGDTAISINFSHYWEDAIIETDDYDTITFTNDSYDQMSVDNLRYLISEIYLTNSSSTIIPLQDYLLIDAKNKENINLSTSSFLIEDTYTLYFRFGLADENNISNSYSDLDEDNFNLPEEYGDGYYFMQLDGKFINESDETTTYNYHMARALNNVNIDSTYTVDTSFLVNAGNFTLEDKSTSIEVKVDLSEWFTDPNDWDLNENNTQLLENYEAQLSMNQNGDSVFSILDEDE